MFDVIRLFSISICDNIRWIGFKSDHQGLMDSIFRKRVGKKPGGRVRISIIAFQMNSIRYWEGGKFREHEFQGFELV